jgi:surface carbohydrate biosynthesis protein
MCVPDRLRDLEGHALVAFHLRERHGHEVRLVGPANLESGFFEYAPDALVLDYLGWQDRVSMAAIARKFGVPVLVLPTAGLYQYEELELRRAGKLLQANRYIDCYLAWGEESRRNLLKAKMLEDAQITVVGCPRFDFYASPYLTLMEDRATLLSRFGAPVSDAPVILWTTNTCFAHGPQRDQVRSQIRHGRRPRRDFEEEMEDNRTQFAAQSASILEVARQHPEWTFLVKIHPFEAVEPYRDLAERVPNLYVLKDVPVRHVLYHADVVIQRGCTTATEAWMLGKPVVEIEIGKFHHALRADYAAGNEPVTDVAGLEQAIQRYLEGARVAPDLQKARDAFIGEVYRDVSGKASERCADTIDAVIAVQGLAEAQRAEREARIREEQRARVRRSDERMINRVKDVLGVDRDRSLRLWWRNVRDSWRKPQKPHREIDARDLYRQFQEATARVRAERPSR